MSKERAKDLLQIVSEVTHGIYALEKGDTIELVDEIASPLSIMEYEAHGYTVHHH